MRLAAPSAVLREATPAPVTELSIYLTELGGPTVLLVLLSVLYWVDDSRSTALVVSYAFAGVLVVLAAKHAVAMPRPPATHHVVDPGSPNGFPSGHAAAATVVFGGLALERGWHGPLALGSTAAVVATVALTRVVLGVHFLGDVLAGIAIALALLGLLHVVAAGRPRRPFALAVVVAVPVVVLAGPTEDVLLGVGGAVGGLLATLREAPLSVVLDGGERALALVLGSVWLGLGITVAGAVEGSLPLALLTNAALVAGILLVPLSVRLASDRVARPSGSRARAKQ